MNEEIQEIKEMAKRNYELISKNTENINNNLERINKNSYVLDILRDYKQDSERLFLILLIILGLWIGPLGYLIFILSR